jgi:RNA polymerase sigma factor (sigma-70 family)
MANLSEPDRKTAWVLNQNAFKHLLNWLDEDADSGGQRYVEIRCRLVLYFDRKNCSSLDELADETLNRVARRLEEEREITGSTPAQYCFIVARYVFLESLRGRHHEEPLQESLTAPPDSHEEREQEQRRSDCLDHCLQTLDPEERNIILGYYQGERRTKIQNRKAMAVKLEVSINALSIRACRIRSKLEKCLQKCLKSTE